MGVFAICEFCDNAIAITEKYQKQAKRPRSSLAPTDNVAVWPWAILLTVISNPVK